MKKAPNKIKALTWKPKQSGAKQLTVQSIEARVSILGFFSFYTSLCFSTLFSIINHSVAKADIQCGPEYFSNKSVKNEPIETIIGTLNFESLKRSLRNAANIPSITQKQSFFSNKSSSAFERGVEVRSCNWTTCRGIKLGLSLHWLWPYCGLLASYFWQLLLLVARVQNAAAANLARCGRWTRRCSRTSRVRSRRVQSACTACPPSGRPAGSGAAASSACRRPSSPCCSLHRPPRRRFDPPTNRSPSLPF